MLYPKRYRELNPAGVATLVAVVIVSAATFAKQASALRITSPARDVIVSGSTRIEVAIEPASELANVKTVTFSVNGRLACTLERPPFTTARSSRATSSADTTSASWRR